MKRISRAVKILVNMTVIAALMCSLTGCTNDFDNQESESVTVTQKIVEEEISAVSETTQNAETSYETEETTATLTTDGAAYPIPEGWSLEKISTLIEYNGIPLKFPCTVDDFENIDDEIELIDFNENRCLYHVNKNDVNIIQLVTKKDTGESISVLYRFENVNTNEVINEMTFAGYSSEQENEINSFLDENFNLSYEYYSPRANKFYMKSYSFELEGDRNVELRVSFRESKVIHILVQYIKK